jgi:hypothetical protein
MKDDDKTPEIADDNMCKKPCRACPYRKESAPGWLGSSSPEYFMRTTFGEEGFMTGPESPMPCHLTIDYEDPDWRKRWEEGWATGEGTGSLCAGAAVMFANRVKMPKFIRLPVREADHENVFSSTSEFIAHHRGGSVHSWDDNDPVDDMDGDHESALESVYGSNE